MIELVIGLFTNAIPNVSIMLGNKVVKTVFPRGFIEVDSMLSGIIGFITYLTVIIILIVVLMRLI